MSQPQTESAPRSAFPDPDAALVCFAKRGFHQTSMHDISAEAGISVGLIYRYFENKEAVISAMADRHKKEITKCWNARARRRALLESLEILFTAHCCEEQPPVVSAFVVDLYAEASRNPHVADLVRDVLQTAMDGVTESDRALAGSSKYRRTAFRQIELAELIFAVARGMLMLDVLRPQEMTATERRDATIGSDAQTLALVV